MSLAEIREKNKKSIKSELDWEIKNTMPPEIAKQIKEDMFEGFIKPVGYSTFARYCEENPE